MKRSRIVMAALALCACSQSVDGASGHEEPRSALVEQPQPRLVVANPSERRYGIGIRPPAGGESSLRVLFVSPEGVANAAGLKKEDLIIAINDTLVSDLSPGEISSAMRRSPLKLRIDSRGEITSIEMSLDEPATQPSSETLEEHASHDANLDFEAAALELADILEDRYLFPEVGAGYAEMLRRNVGEGRYSRIDDAISFAALVSQQLSEISVDRHLHITPPGAGSIGKRMVRGNSDTFDISESVPRSGWLADGVAFMEITLMPPDPSLKSWAAKFMQDHSDARAFVLDLRMCRGGTIDMMNGFLPYLYGEETHLVTMDMREGSDARLVAQFDEFDELKRSPAEEGLTRWEHRISPSVIANKPEMPVFVLTNFTGSACEHLTLALKATERAIVIGRTTGGAGHFATIVDFGGGFTLMLPVGRTYDPETGRGWEGIGIEPDIAIDPDLADEKVLELLNQTGN